MRSTGEVMGIDRTFGRAFYKAELAAGTILPTDGTVFLSLADTDKPAGLVVAKRLRELGLGHRRHRGHGRLPRPLRRAGRPGRRPRCRTATGSTAVDLIADGKISVRRQHARRATVGRSDGEQIRKAASLHRVGCVTTVDAALAAVQGLAERDGEPVEVRSLQEYHAPRSD